MIQSTLKDAISLLMIQNTILGRQGMQLRHLRYNLHYWVRYATVSRLNDKCKGFVIENTLRKYTNG